MSRRKPSSTPAPGRRAANGRIALSPDRPIPVIMHAEYDPAAHTVVVPLQYPLKVTAPAVQAWLEVAPTYALRVLVCTDCGQRCATEVRRALGRRKMTPASWETVLADAANDFTGEGLPGKGSHARCRPLAGSGAAACRESVWRVPGTVPAVHRFEIDAFLDDTVGTTTRENEVLALLRVRHADGSCVSVREVLPPVLPGAEAAEPASRGWYGALHAWLRTVAQQHGGKLEAVAFVTLLAEPVELLGYARVVAIVTVATDGRAYQGVMCAPEDGALPDGEGAKWRVIGAPSLVDRLFATVFE